MIKRNIGDEIIKGMEEAIGYMQGKKKHAIVHKVEIPNEIDVRAIRKNLKFLERNLLTALVLAQGHYNIGNKGIDTPMVLQEFSYYCCNVNLLRLKKY